MPVDKNINKRLQLLEGFLISRRGYTMAEIQEKVNESLLKDGFEGIAIRSVYEDIKRIEELGIEIEKLKGAKRRYKYEDDTIWKTTLLDEEKKLLEMAVNTFSVFKGSSIYQKFNDVITRIMAGSMLRSLNADNSKILQVGESSNNSGHEWIETIYQAITNKQALTMTYKSYGKEESTRTISPYLLKEYRNEWHMLAYSTANRPNAGTNVFKLCRIQKLTETKEAFFVDPNFNADEYFKYSLGIYHKHNQAPVEVKLLVKKDKIAQFQETPIHPTQEIISKSETEMIITFKVYHTAELISTILGFGRDVALISPKDLKDEIINNLKHSLKNYE